MDIVQTNKTPKRRKTILIGISLAVVFGATLFFALTANDASYLAARDRLLVDTVQRGDLRIAVRGTGVLVPDDIRWISTSVSGRVEQIFKQPGAQVKQGELLLVLSNPQLEQQLIEAQWELQALEAEANASRVALESELLDQQIAVINEKLNHERALLTLEAQQTLLAQGIVAISKIDYEEVKIDAVQFNQRWELEQERLKKRQENLQAHSLASEARLTLMRKSVERIQQQVDGLQVKASIDSLVQQLPLELGQLVSPGANLALLARRDRFIAELQIPEKQIKDVLIGQHVQLDTRNNQIAGRVSRIAPSVVNNAVQVDVALLGTLPNEVRPELTVEGEIEITTIADTLFVKRPVYASSFSEFAIYKLDAEGTKASKNTINLGYMSSQFVQIEQGLAAGDQVIVSDSSPWQQHQQIGIK